MVQIQASSHMLLRETTIRGTGVIATYAVPQEALRVNQSQHVSIEQCDISGAWDNAIDFVAVQYGHVVGSRIHRSGDWAMYAKGGAASLTITGNDFFDAGTGGFTAGREESIPDKNLVIVNNVVFNPDGAASQWQQFAVAAPRTPTADVATTNAINTVRPVFADLARGDYRLAASFTPPATGGIRILS